MSCNLDTPPTVAPILISSGTVYEQVSIKELRPLVAIDFTDMGMGVMDYHLMSSYINFCRDTGILQRILEVVPQKGVSDYPLIPPDAHSIFKVDRVFDKNGCYSQQTVSPHIHLRHYYYRSGVILLGNEPQGHLSVDIIAVPTRNTCWIDADVYHHWADAIAADFRSTVMGGNVKKWRNISGARDNKNHYALMVEQAQDSIRSGGMTKKVYYAETTSFIKGGRVVIHHR